MIKRILFKLAVISILFSFNAVGLTNSNYVDTETSSGNSFTAACWGAPDIPDKLTPSEYINYADVSFSWTATTNDCPSSTTYYKFQIASNDSFTSGLQETGWQTTTNHSINGMTEGEYWWRIIVKDQYDYTATGPANHLVIDWTDPSDVSLSVSGSAYRTVEEEIDNGSFENGLTGWLKTGKADVVGSKTITDAAPASTITINPYDGSKMIELGRDDTKVWTNRLMKSFDNTAKTLSLYYNFFSRDFTPYDDPGYFIRLNGQEILHLDTLIVNPTDIVDGKARYTGWQEFNYNLSNIAGSKINLAIYAGNTGGDVDRSWVYLDKISTKFIAAKADSKYRLNSTDNRSGIDYCEYVKGNDLPVKIAPDADFTLSGSGRFNLQYHCVDKSSNSSPTYIVGVIIDTKAPSSIADFVASTDPTVPNVIDLNWKAPVNDYDDNSSGRISQYDIRYSTSPIITDTDFNNAAIVDKIPAPQSPGTIEYLPVLGLNPDTLYYFAIKAGDESGNWSAIATTSTTTPVSTNTVNAGDIVINELMWMGSSGSSADEWIELRNMTDHDITITGFKLNKFNGTTLVSMLTLPSGTIPAKSYYLVSNYNPSHANSRLKNSLTVNYVTSSIDLSNSTLQIELTDASDNRIDIAWNGYSPKEGMSGSARYYSMERTGIPGDGTNPLNWYTCIDAASTMDFFDGGTDERGTPGAPNRSENEPPLIDLNIPEKTSTPEANLLLSADNHTVGFIVSNIAKYIKISYELTYDSDSSPQGIIGEQELNGQNEYVKDNMKLSTCSSGGSCVYHTNVNNILLKVTLYDTANNETNVIARE